jgi:Protein of unknown function (DUF4232)
MRGSRTLAALAAMLMLAGCADTPATTAAPPTPSASGTALASRTAPASRIASASASGTAPAASPTAATSLAAQPIPWIDAPVAKQPPPPDPNAQFAHPALYRPCTAADLTATADGWGPLTGTVYEWISFTNRSSSACTLSGSPRSITNVYRDGSRHPVPLSTKDVGFGIGLDAVANLAPGEVGRSQLRESDHCAGFQRGFYVQRFDVELPDGSAVEVTVPGSHYQTPSVGCGASASWFGTQHKQVPEPASPNDPLVVTTSMPATVSASSLVDYTVTLTNPTAKAVSLTPCPSYEDNFNAYPDIVDKLYRLNCDGHQQVAPHEALTFAMRITAPTRRGQARFGWYLQPVGRAGIGALVEVD